MSKSGGLSPCMRNELEESRKGGTRAELVRAKESRRRVLFPVPGSFGSVLLLRYDGECVVAVGRHPLYAIPATAAAISQRGKTTSCVSTSR